MDNYLKKALSLEKKRQQGNIELIASENYVSKDVLKLQGSPSFPLQFPELQTQ